MSSIRLNNKIHYQVNHIDQLSIINPYNTTKQKEVVVHWSSKEVNFDQGILLSNMVSLIKSVGQRPKITVSRKGVARYGIREGAMVGLKVVLHGRNGVRLHRIKKLGNYVIQGNII